MEIIHANESNFNNLVSNGIVIVDFFANWCGPCKMQSAVLEEMKEDRDTTKIVKIDVDECGALAKTYGVMSIPTLILFKDGKLIEKKVGFMPKEELLNWIQNIGSMSSSVGGTKN